jgi:predicted TIM-barrel fold metal-dependent hydrolase
VRTAVERYSVIGIKVHRGDAPISGEICDAARRFGIPVLYDPMGDVHVAELLATQYPDVDFILPHLGSFADKWSSQLALVDHLARHPNIYTDTSGIRRFDLLVEAVRRAGPHKVLFGSDGPWLHPGLELHKVRLLGLNREDEALVMGGNFLRLIGREK